MERTRKKRALTRIFSRTFRENQQTGFGNNGKVMGNRLIKPDGTYNVTKTGLSFLQELSPFHSLITMSWFSFVMVILGVFVALNIIFATFYMFIGFDEFTGFAYNHAIGKFVDLLSFSAQTLTTVGYGRINPIGIWADFVSSIEALTGLMGFALVTGLVYGRFSRPIAKLIHSESAIIAPFNEINALMIRVANARKNQLLECEAVVMLSVINPETGTRKFITLNLEFAKISALALSWTIVHPINEDSPLYELTETDLQETQAEILVLFKAYDDTYNQHIHTRFSYPNHEIIWGKKFLPMYHRSETDNSTILDLQKISLVQDAPLKLKFNPEYQNNSTE